MKILLIYIMDIIKIINMLKYIFFLILFLPYFSFSYQYETQSFFIENNGQLLDQNFNSNENVKYYLMKDNVKLLLEKESFSYQIQKLKEKDCYILNRIEFNFFNVNPKCEIIPSDKTIEKLYFYNHLNSIKSSTYEKIIYKNVWNDVDIIFYSSGNRNSFKYDIVLRSGANIKDIKFKILGADKIRLVGDELNIQVGDIELIEKIPISIIDNSRKINVDYHLENNVISFNVLGGTYKDSLIIDPILNFSTYFGGSNDDTALEICTDTSNNVIITGFTMSVNNIATSGVYQTELRGSADAFVAKFNSNGQRLWASYFGGSDYDTGHSIASFVNGDIVMVGWTKSKSNIATTDAHQKYFSGGEFDSYIAKFTAGGQLIWSTYYGGSNDDYINDVTINGNNEIIVVGQTTSQINISSLYSYQEQLSGSFDAFVAKFNAQGRRLWGTYYGGTGFDVGMEITTDIFNDIVITGYTQSRNNIATTNGWKTELWGSWDAFLAKFNNDGNMKWATYFGGNGEDNGRGVDIDGLGNIYLTGYTLSTDSLATQGVYKDTISSAEADVFLAKFNRNGDLQWASYYGGTDIDIGNMVIINPWNYCMVAGNSASSNGITTVDAYKSINAGLNDMFYAIFDSSSYLIYGTYYGGEGNDYGHGLALDRRNNIYFTGYTNSRYGISTPNAHQENLGGGNDAVLMRFYESALNDTIIVGNINDQICADNFIQIPFTAIGDFDSTNVFIAQLSNAQGSFIDFINIGVLQSISSGTITAYLPKELKTSDKYRIRIISTNPPIISKNEAMLLSFYELPKVNIKGNLQVCRNDVYEYYSDPNVDYHFQWYVNAGKIVGSDTSNKVTILWDSVTTATLKLIITNVITECKDSNAIQITINPNMEVSEIFGESIVCPETEILYYTVSNSYTSNLWEIENGVIVTDSTLDSILVKWQEKSKGKLKLKQISNLTGCSDSTFINVIINDQPEPFIIGDSVVAARSVTEYRTSPNSKYNYEWKIKFAEIIGDKNSTKIQVKWGTIGSDTLTLIMKDKETGCIDSLVLPIKIYLNPNELIIGDTLVCAQSSVTYSYNDENYFKKWYTYGGKIEGPDSLDFVTVLWELPGNASLILIRTDKQTYALDTITLPVKILSLPDASIYGNNEVCENQMEFYYTVHSADDEILWEVRNGNIIGENDKDTIVVFWGKISDDTTQSAKLFLHIKDLKTGCTNTIVYKIFQSRNPVLNIIGDSIVCEKEINTFYIDSDEELNVIWKLNYGEVINFQNDTLLISWSYAGLDTLIIIAVNKSNCIDTILIPIIINQNPPQPIIIQSGNSLISSADYGNQWFLNGQIIPGANQKIYIPTKSGNYTVQVTSEDNCHSLMSEPIYFEINSVVNNTKFYSIQPNPAKDFVLINFNSYINSKIINFDVVDVMGKNRKKIIYETAINSFMIDIKDLNEGIYFVIISYEDKKLVDKIIKY